MIKRLFLISALLIGGATAANAQEAASTSTTTATTTTTVDLPLCSRTVTDKCINRTASKRTVVKHRNNKVVKSSTKVTTKTTG